MDTITTQALLKAKQLIVTTLHEQNDAVDSLKLTSVENLGKFVRYSHDITYTSHAPNGYQIGAPLYQFHPPAPQAEQMRASVLSKYNDSEFTVRETLHKPLIEIKETWPPALSFMALLKEEIMLRENQNLREVRNEVVSHAEEEKVEERQDIPVVSSIDVEPPTKKSRSINISFGDFDSDDSED